MTKRKIILRQENKKKVGTVPNKYRPIKYLPMIWKIPTTQLKKEIYYSQIKPQQIPEEKK